MMPGSDGAWLLTNVPFGHVGLLDKNSKTIQTYQETYVFLRVLSFFLVAGGSGNTIALLPVL